MNKEEIVKKILETIGSEKFWSWYKSGGRFDQWISGDTGAPTETEIKQDIEKLFHLN